MRAQTSNHEAIAFYERFGFEAGEVVPAYYKRLDPPDAVILTKRLGSSSGASGGGGASSGNDAVR